MNERITQRMREALETLRGKRLIHETMIKRKFQKWIFLKFVQGLWKQLKLGDSDSTGSHHHDIYGQARHSSAIDSEWRRQLIYSNNEEENEIKVGHGLGWESVKNLFYIQ